MSTSQTRKIQFRAFPPSVHTHTIFVLQSPESRAITVGFLAKKNGKLSFIPGRLHFGAPRMVDTYKATVQSLAQPPIKRILTRYKPEHISTITVLRETLACNLPLALNDVGITNYYGDAYIGASHIKDNGPIRTAYLYENTEGLTPHGLWIIADSICMGRNLVATLESLLKKFAPKEILFVCPIASRLGINNVGAVIAKHKIPTTFVAWGALFGVDKKTLYDMPWGHPDTEPLDKRDQDLVVSMYGTKLCMGGDFGNAYYCPSLALDLYKDQLRSVPIKPKIPTVKQVLSIYKHGEILIR